MAVRKIDVFVYEDGDDLKVYPAVISADGGSGSSGGQPNQLVFHNNTNEDLVFCFSAKAMSKAFIGVDKNQTSSGDAVNSVGAGKSDLFPFQVVAYKKGKKAKANSDPILIVEN